MPGVPSGRGCEACRKQKKKCDQAKPACSRCSRLRIPCVGSGQQRYKFMEQRIAAPENTNANATKARINTVELTIRAPSNEMTRVLGAFVSRLEITDLRYDLTWYGEFLRGVPSRLGSNEVLDASAGALTAATSLLQTGHQSPEFFTTFGNAIKILRYWLDDPVKTCTPDTLCAIYLIMIIQSWMAYPDDVNIGHGEVIAHILSAADFEAWKSDFEVEMLVTLCVPVILESIFNPRIVLYPWFDKLLKAYGPPKPEPDSTKSGFDEKEQPFFDGSQIHSMKLRNLVRIPAFMQNPGMHLAEMTNLYELMRVDSRRLRDYLNRTSDMGSPGLFMDISVPSQSLKMRTRYQGGYGVLLVLTICINGVLRAFNPFDAELDEDARHFANEVMTLARETEHLRPLGASYIPLCLVAAWAALDDPDMQMQCVNKLAEWHRDKGLERYMEGAIWLKNKFDCLRVQVFNSQLKQSEDYYLGDNLGIKIEPEDVRVLNESCPVQ